MPVLSFLPGSLSGLPVQTARIFMMRAILSAIPFFRHMG
jgi:hypothetical protein